MLNTPVTITTDIDFTSGIINTTSTNILILNSGSTLSGTPSNATHVDGPLRKIGGTAFTFPTGDAGIYRGIGISASGTGTDAFTAEYFKTAQAFGDASTYADGLLTVSACEYWILSQTAGTSSVNVTLSWVSADCSGPYIDPTGLTDLRVARWNNTNWVSHGNGGTTGSSAMGTIVTSAPLSGFSPFTLASVSLINPLPIELINFEARVYGNEVLTRWSTASELNNDFFTVERSSDGLEFSEIGIIKGQGTSQQKSDYQFVDIKPLPDVSYYRLKQTDYDKKSSYSRIVSVTREDGGGLIVYPNPTQGFALANQKGNFILFNSIGQIVLKIADDDEFDLTQLPKGVYTVWDDKGRFLRLVVE